MPRLRAAIPKALWVVCVILFAATIAMWLRSWWVYDIVGVVGPEHTTRLAEGVELPAGPKWVMHASMDHGMFRAGFARDTDAHDSYNFHVRKPWRLGPLEYAGTLCPHSLSTIIDQRGLRLIPNLFRGFSYRVIPRPDETFPGFESYDVSIPSAYFVVAFSLYPILAGIYWWRTSPRRRRSRGQCGACGYDLTGNVSGVCPECGVPVRHGAGVSAGSV